MIGNLLLGAFSTFFWVFGFLALSYGDLVLGLSFIVIGVVGSVHAMSDE